VHGTFVVAVACVIGVPVGVLAGRLTWDEIASYVVVVNRPIAPLTLLTTIVAVLVAVALVVTYIPARQARRIRPAVALRAF
jgi:ABC-type antimicrobial peptide transport system permease subunit